MLAKKTDINLEHERLSSLINSMADGVIALSEDIKVVMYNGAALNILDINSGMIGARIEDVFKLVDANGQQVDTKNLIKNTKVSTSSRDYRLQYPDSSFINLYVSIAPVHLGYGKNGDKGYVVLLRDITREKSLEEERNEFISVVSHELRTPIAIAEGNVGNAMYVAEKVSGIDSIKSAIKQAHDQIIYLSDMINDLSTLSRAERGTLQVDVEPINVHELIQTLQKSYADQAQKKGLDMHIQLDPSLELLNSSKLYVKEILQNFVTNAIKYTEKGSVTVGARPVDHGVEFFVSDTGIGINRADQERVWDKFFRSEDYRTRQNNGTGLGLYVTAKLARLVHADVSLKSELNKGSTFTISIPNLQPVPDPHK
ncbi:PAS domain-containing protein [bacterium]|nr:PAS domain-containing protein [bacterium]NDC94071.1 PAS domain-containing protein [bacterium]NDD84580.1 PAS domain-containing protein [bacterium]NDG29318.1 PAS domain-containing protein [bacterium]